MKQVAKLAAIAIAALAIAGGVRAQDSTTTAPSVMDATAEVKAKSYVQQTAVDDLFAAQSSELALKKSTNPQVRSFAKNLLKDHATASQELKQTLQTAKVDAAPPSVLDPEHQQLLDTLKSSSGGEFDRKYLKMQMDGHQQDLQTQVDYRLHGDNPQLQDYAAKASMRVQTRMGQLGKISQGSMLE
jgi:putative membrane protein